MSTSVKLIVLCDGSWCGREKDTKSNIHVLAEMIGIDMSREPRVLHDRIRNVRARYFNEVDVNSTFMDYFCNTAIETDIENQCKDVYEYIVHNYTQDTEIWMFGYSRGSYIIRCVAGMINNCGIIKQKGDPNQTRLICGEVYQIYRSRSNIDAPWSLEMIRFKRDKSWQVDTPVKFMGILDTVGRLGVPRPVVRSGPLEKQLLNFFGVGSQSLPFHNQNVSSVVENVYHAVSMHDRLFILEPCLALKDTTMHSENGPPHIHEKWFPGAHYDVGRQSFSFFRESAKNLVKMTTVSLPKWLDETVRPNEVLSDLVLKWILESIKSEQGTQIITGLDEKISQLLRNGDYAIGSGDIYVRAMPNRWFEMIFTYANLCFEMLVVCLHRFHSVPSYFISTYTNPVFEILAIGHDRFHSVLWDWLVIITSLPILLNVGDRKISNRAADTYDYMKWDPQLNGSVRYLAAMSRYQSMTYKATKRLEIRWKAPDFYRSFDAVSDDVFDDVLTVTRTSMDGHSFIALTVSEFLNKYYDKFGQDLLRWFTRLCREIQEAKKRTLEQLNLPQFCVRVLAGRSVIADSTDLPTASVSVATDSDGSVLHLTVSALFEDALQLESAITWMVSVLQPCDNETGLFQGYCSMVENWTIGDPVVERFTPDKGGPYCWIKLFDYVRIAACPRNVQIMDQPEGLEIDFELLRSLAAVPYQYKTEKGIILFGVNTVLFPAGQEGRWHLLRTDKIGSLPDLLQEAHSHLEESASATQNKLPEGKVYLGWCDTPVIKIGTTVPDNLPRSAVEVLEELESSSGRSVSNQVSMELTASFFGTGAGVGGGQTRTTTWKPGAVVGAGVDIDRFFEQVLIAACERPCILWDDSTKRAWLLPAVSALIFATLCFIKIHNLEFKAKDTEAPHSTFIDAIFGEKSMVASLLQFRNPWRRTQQASTSQIRPKQPTYPRASNNAKESALSCLKDNWSLQLSTVQGCQVTSEVTFRDIAIIVWHRMTVAERQCYSSLSPRMLGKDNELLGSDLREVISLEPIHIRSINVDDNNMSSLRSWCRLVRARRLQVIFAGEVGPVIECSSPSCLPCCSDICRQQRETRGTLSCFLRDLKFFYGSTGWNSPECLPLQNHLRWIPSGYGCLSHSNTGLRADGPCACCADLGRLQSIVPSTGIHSGRSFFPEILKLNRWRRQRRPMQAEVSEWLDDKAMQGSGAIRFGHLPNR